MSVHFSSASNEWHTPRDFFEPLNAEFNFTLDVAATAENALCPRYFTEADNGFAQRPTKATRGRGSIRHDAKLR